MLDIQIHKNIDHFMFAYGSDRDIEDSVGVLLHGWEAGGGVEMDCFFCILDRSKRSSTVNSKHDVMNLHISVPSST